MGLLLEDLDLGGTSGRVVAALGQSVRDRFELLLLELREEKIRFTQILILVCFAVVFGLLGLVLAVLALVSLLPEHLRAAGLGALAGAFLVATAWALCGLKRRLGGQHKPFAQSLAELEKDKTCF